MVKSVEVVKSTNEFESVDATNIISTHDDNVNNIENHSKESDDNVEQNGEENHSKKNGNCSSTNLVNEEHEKIGESELSGENKENCDTLKPQIRLVPLEKLLQQKNIPTPIVISDNSDDNDRPQKSTRKRLNKNDANKILPKRKRSSETGDKNFTKKYAYVRSRANEVREKIRKALASDTSDDDNNEKSNKSSKTTTTTSSSQKSKKSITDVITNGKKTEPTAKRRDQHQSLVNNHPQVKHLKSSASLSAEVNQSNSNEHNNNNQFKLKKLKVRLKRMNSDLQTYLKTTKVDIKKPDVDVDDVDAQDKDKIKNKEEQKKQQKRDKKKKKEKKNNRLKGIVNYSDDDGEIVDASQTNDYNSESNVKKTKKPPPQKHKARRMLSSSDEETNDQQNDGIEIISSSSSSSSSSTSVSGSQSSSSSSESSNSSEVRRKKPFVSRAKESDDNSENEMQRNENGQKNSCDIDDDESDSVDEPKKKTKNKRKRIRKPSDSSDDEDGANGANKKRKNIRKLIKTDDLNLDTKQAAQMEKDRRKRIQERQKLYNSIYEKPEKVELEELILDFDEETKKPLLKVDDGIIKLLKPHQAKGIKFMFDACFESLKDVENSEGGGCILAHCMGLGKTLQVIALTHSLITYSSRTLIERALIITPLSTLTNWSREYHMWMRSCKKKNIEIYDMSKFKDKNLRIFKINEWYEDGGVLIMGYDMFRILSNEKTKGLRKKQRETLQQCLVNPGPDIVVCDEGHLLKNEKTSLSQAVTKMRTKRRIVLTGTPLQNNLKEYYCMIQFIKPNLLGTFKEYLNRFVNPITNGQYTDSTEHDIRLMKHRSHILHKLLEGCIQRCDYSVLSPYLPPKHEYVIYITLTEVQMKLYEYYMTTQRGYAEDINGKGAKLFQDFQNLRRIWTHPKNLRVNSDIVIKKKLLQDISESEGSLKDFIDDDSDTDETDSDVASVHSGQSIESEGKRKVKTRLQKKLGAEDSDIEEAPAVPTEDPSEWWCQFVPKEELNNINHSSKLILLMKTLDECEKIGDKLLLFSQSLQSLDVIEEFLSFIDQKTKDIETDANVNGFSGRWTQGLDYFRLDGSSSVENREAMCKAFNDTTNLRARLFLISTRAGSLGINLVAANRVIIFDVSWNPSHDTQSIFRVYRFGQTKPCYVYRFIAMGTMEQKVYERQVAKQAMAKRVIDEQQIGRHYNQNDLLELYTYELVPKEPRAIPNLPKDRLFAELLANYEKIIYKYHEHDSLLENQESDNLSEEERKAAWDEYEIEKNRPQQQYFIQNRTNYTMGAGGTYIATQGGFQTTHHGPVTSNKIFGFRTDILLRLLNMKVSRDHPQFAPHDVVQMVPMYLKQLYAEMNQENPTMYLELLDLHKQLEMPQGSFMNPLLYSNQQEVEPQSKRMGPHPFAVANATAPPTTSTEIVEID